jgi:small subunit ribosomal protein S2
MKKFIFGKKKNIYVIDLEKTAAQLEKAKEFVSKLAQDGEKILFVATKKQIRDVVREMAISCKMPYSGDRWVGGFLTNFPTISTRIRKYVELLTKKESGGFEEMSHKDLVRVRRELERMEKNYSGVKDLKDLPGCIFIIDPKREHACVQEAIKIGIPVVALVDTDADPDLMEYPIPGNDDAIKSVRFIASCIAEAIKEGAQKSVDLLKAKQEQEKKDADEKAAKIKIGDKEPDVAKYEDLEEEIVEKGEKEVLKKKLTQKEV